MINYLSWIIESLPYIQIKAQTYFFKKPCVLYNLGFFDKFFKKITLYQNLEVITHHYVLKS